jgi:serine/threonine protein phosphatase PrpC
VVKCRRALSSIVHYCTLQLSAVQISTVHNSAMQESLPVIIIITPVYLHAKHTGHRLFCPNVGDSRTLLCR